MTKEYATVSEASAKDLAKRLTEEQDSAGASPWTVLSVVKDGRSYVAILEREKPWSPSPAPPPETERDRLLREELEDARRRQQGDDSVA